MKPYELFKIVAHADYQTVGLSLDYTIETIDGRACLFFQQSSQNEDWVHNFEFVAKVYKNQENHMRVHHGFAKVWKSANDQIMSEFIEAVKKSKKKPLIAGWSFGGAMCQLAAEDFFYRTEIRADVVTFGAPKISADKKTAAHISSCGDFLQFAQRNDIVTKCPPLPWFHHVHKVDLGRKFNIIEIFKPQIYHADYDNVELYEGTAYDTNI